MLVYSGRRNPNKIIFPGESDYEEIRAKIRILSRFFSPYNCIPPKSGYKGFLIQSSEEVREQLVLGKETVRLQELLHDSFPGQFVPTGIREVITSKFVSKECPPDNKGRRKRFEPDYIPQHWTFNDRELECNNCYNYANIKKTNTYAQPGGEAFTRDQLTAATVKNLARGDGLKFFEPESVPIRSFPFGDDHLVALFVNEG